MLTILSYWLFLLVTLWLQKVLVSNVPTKMFNINKTINFALNNVLNGYLKSRSHDAD